MVNVLSRGTPRLLTVSNGTVPEYRQADEYWQKWRTVSLCLVPTNIVSVFEDVPFIDFMHLVTRMPVRLRSLLLCLTSFEC